MIYILFMVLSVGGASTQEFKSLQSCELAAKNFVKVTEPLGGTAWCVMK